MTPATKPFRAVLCLALLQCAGLAPAAAADFTITPDMHLGFGNYYWNISVEGAAGTANPPLFIARNQNYTFAVAASFTHPFWIDSATGIGSMAHAYTGTGLSSNGITSAGTISFDVPDDAADTLYYACGNHFEMNGMIHVVVFREGFD